MSDHEELQEQPRDATGMHPPVRPGLKPTELEEPHLLRGNVKLMGVAGLVKGETFTVTLGRTVVIGRSRECDICLRDLPAAQKLGQGESLEQHFRTVSRRHMRLTYHAPDNVEIEDLSSNGLFVDGHRVEKVMVLKDLVQHPHEIKLGTTETFCMDWWRLVPRSEVQMVTVKLAPQAKRAPPTDGEEEAVIAEEHAEAKDEEGGEAAESKKADEKSPEK